MITVEEIFADAAELSPGERAAYLDRACAGDAESRARVESLRAGHDAAAGLRSALSRRADGLREEKAGDRIGRYKLLEKIGEGGCGIVWAAEQGEPVRRRVALKVIKLGMETKEVVARFEAERQALALMDHPGIAKVFDAGATGTGRRFFVMELVRGVPITRYCDEARLSLPARLTLFIDVCHAIQHAHQKGVIHRDIKPSNILVTLHDDVAVPKVIDFGIAKAVQGRLTAATVYTSFAQFIGTPAYMCPEQAEYNALDVDTRSDVYSLGVLLYELLTGQPPFDPKTLGQTGLDEVRRIIREVDPPRPSTRLRPLTAGAAAGRDSNRRRVAPRPPPVTARELRGDLDWIVMKALEKNRVRRYQTASAFAADVRRYLEGEPVVARPPSATYRFRKFVRRHRVAVAAGVLIFVSLLAGLTVITAAVVREKRAHRDAHRAELTVSDARQNAERLLTFIVSELGEELDQLGQLPALRRLNRQVLEYYEQLSPALHTRETRAGLAFARTGLNTVGWFNMGHASEFRLGYAAGRVPLEEALRVMEELEATGPLTPFIRIAYAGVVWGMIGQCYHEEREFLAAPLLPRAETLLQPVLSDPRWGDWADRFTVKLIVGRAFFAQKHPDLESQHHAIGEYRRALARATERDRRGLDQRRPGLLSAVIRVQLSMRLRAVGAEAEAGATMAEAQRQLRELLAREPFLATAGLWLGNSLRFEAGHARAQWRFDLCRPAIEEAFRILKQVAKHDPPGTIGNSPFAATLVAPEGRGKFSYDWLDRDFAAAEIDLRQGMERYVQPQLPPRFWSWLWSARLNLARVYAATYRDAEADQQLAEAQAITRQLVEERPWLTPAERRARAVADEAERCAVEVERLNWSAVRAGATRMLQAGAAPEVDAETAAPANSGKIAHRYLMRAAFETGDYARARRELEAGNPRVTLLPATSEIEFRFQRVRELLTRIHVLARAGEVAAARAELARVWGEAEEIFEAGREHHFVRIEHARALAIRAEIEDADAAAKREWLERAATWMRPAAAAGRLTRYEREVVLRRIELQIAGLAGATVR